MGVWNAAFCEVVAVVTVVEPGVDTVPPGAVAAGGSAAFAMLAVDCRTRAKSARSVALNARSCENVPAAFVPNEFVVGVSEETLFVPEGLNPNWLVATPN
jgi:hypothetical protein